MPSFGGQPYQVTAAPANVENNTVAIRHACSGMRTALLT